MTDQLRKKRVLLNNEASFISTGFATYGAELLKGLVQNPELEIAELASYGDPRDIRQYELPWKYYGNLPTNDAEASNYKAKATYQFGEFRFDDVCIEFQPDIVLSIRDIYMDEHIERAPARPYFQWIYMSTVDSEPQDDTWISTMANADQVLCYTDYGTNLLKRQAGAAINVVGSAPLCANLDIYQVPKNKVELKAQAGLPSNSNIIGTVMRNQKRKLYPDLFAAFKQFLETAPEYLRQNTFLYCHTAYPDITWDIPKLLKEIGISHKVYFTYFCKVCQAVYPSFFHDSVAYCRVCGRPEAIMPSVKDGAPVQVMGKIMQLFDVYVQYACCEGAGAPQIEAAACGVPVFAVDYSGMADIVRKVNGFPIKVERMFLEPDGHLWRAYPDNADFVRKLIDYLKLPQSMRAKHGYEARKGVETHYTWNKTIKVWEQCITAAPLSKWWESPPNYHQSARVEPAQLAKLNNADFIRWGLEHIGGRPDLVHSHIASRLIRDLNAGRCLEGAPSMFSKQELCHEAETKYGAVNRDMLLEQFKIVCLNRNFFESRREQYVKANQKS